MKRLHSRRIAAALAVAVLAGLTAGTTTSAADPVSLTQNQTCPFPLIGNRVVPAVIQADIPKYAAVGETVPARTIGVHLRFTAEEAENLRLGRVEGIAADAALRVTVDKPDADETVALPLRFAERPVPATGGFDVSAWAVLPGFTVTAPGQTRILADTANLTLHARAGSLGGFDSPCSAQPEQDRTLATITTPHPGVPVSVELATVCQMPLIGAQPTSVTTASNFPVSGIVGRPVGPLPFSVEIGFSAQTAEGFRLIDATLVGGTADLGLEIRQAGETRRVTVRVHIPDTPVPASGAMAATGSGWLDAQTFQRWGRADFHVVSVALDLRLRGPWIEPVQEVHIPCEINAGQNALIGSIEVFADITPPPSAPRDLAVTAVTHDSVSLAWSASITDDIAHYVVITTAGSTTVDGTSATITGLAPDTDHRFAVVAVDVIGRQSPPATVTARTKPVVARHTYTLTGSTKVKTSTVALAGTVEASLDLLTNAHTAAVALRPTTATAKLLGVIPAKADVVFAPASATGTLADGVLTTHTDLGVTLPRITVLGFPINTDPACGTTVDLDLTAPFDAAKGGELTGSYTLPPLTGCGRFTDVVNGVVAGEGNTLAITLAP